MTESAYAIIATGGKQHRVTVGEVCNFELLDAEPGSEITFEEVLLVANGEDVAIGAPNLKGAKVKAEVVDHGRGEKIRIVKHRRRKNSHREMGHRQDFTQVKITEINR